MGELGGLFLTNSGQRSKDNFEGIHGSKFRPAGQREKERARARERERERERERKRK